MSSHVPESVRLREKRDAILKAQQVADALLRKSKEECMKKEYVKRAEQYVKEYQEIEKEEIRKRRQAHQDRVFLSEKGDRLVFVVRIRGLNGVPPKPKKILELFRLLQINNGVFIRVNESTQKMLEVIAPYVTFGYPSLTTISNLIYKRGYGRVNKQRVPLSSNEIVSDALKQFNVICMEDVIHEISTVGTHFKEVNSFLWPFKLNPPTGGFRNVKTHFHEGGDLGNREYYINNLVTKML